MDPRLPIQEWLSALGAVMPGRASRERDRTARRILTRLVALQALGALESGLTWPQLCARCARHLGLFDHPDAVPLESILPHILATAPLTDPIALGAFYEASLGYTIKERCHAAPCRDVVRGGGVYYTPLPIVDLLIERTLAPFPTTARLRILDPTCGGGFFLLRAHRFLKARGAPLPVLVGVDIDPDAIEVAQMAGRLGGVTLSLVCADALNWLSTPRDDFDAILGNPPYIKEKDRTAPFDALKRSAFSETYVAKMDIWYSFACAALETLRPGGRHSFITQNNWITAQSARRLRARLRVAARLEELIDFHDHAVFPGARVQTMIYVVSRETPTTRYPFRYARLRTSSPMHFTEITAEMDPTAGEAIIEVVSQKDQVLLAAIAARRADRIERSEVGQGIIGGPDEAFLFPLDEDFTDAERHFLRPHFTAASPFHIGDPRRWIAYLTHTNFPELDAVRYPTFSRRLFQFRAPLSRRREVKRGARRWFHLHWPRDERLFVAGPKLVCPTRVRRPAFVYTTAPVYASRAINIVRAERLDLKYLCGVLNASVTHFWLLSKKRLGSMLQIDTGFLQGIPLAAPTITQRRKVHAWVDHLLADPNDRDMWERLDETVFEIYGLNAEAQQRVLRGIVEK